MGFLRLRKRVCTATLLFVLLLCALASNPPQASASGYSSGLLESNVSAVLPAAASPASARTGARAAWDDSALSGSLAPVAGWLEPAGVITSGTGFSVFSDGFEQSLGSWLATGSPTWGRTSARAATGTYSVYCAGSSLTPPGPYLNEMDAWLVSSPLDLSTISQAQLSFRVWANTEPNDDQVQVLVSVDGTTFYGWAGSGNTSGWIDRGYDLTNIPGLGNACGHSQVWIALVFQSDASVTGEGAYIDDVSLYGSRQLAITSFYPASSPQYGRVALHGAGFTGLTSVRFNGVQAQFDTPSDTYVNAYVPAGATSGPISVTTPQGTAYSVQTFTIIPPPKITGWSPLWGPIGSTVTVTGSGFTGTSEFKFGYTPAAFNVVSDGVLTATVPSGAETATWLAIAAPGGYNSTATGFIVSSTTPAPRPNNFDPAWGPIGCKVKVTGHFFTGAMSVKLSGRAMKFQVDSDEQITAVVPTRAMSGAISVTTQFGTGKVSQFNVIKPRPRVGTPISPRTARAGVRFKVYGTLKPHFPAGSKTVRVRVYKYSGGNWSPIKWLTAVNSNYGTYSKYTVKLSLKRGKYRFWACTRETPEWSPRGSNNSRAMTVK